MKKAFKSIIFLILFLIISSLALLAALNYLNTPLDIQGEEDIIFTIEEGDSLNFIANSLLSSKLLKNSWSLKLYSRLMKTESQFKIGVYRLSPNMTLIELHDYLVEGKQQLYKITIPEGWTSFQIANYLEKKEITLSKDFVKSINSKELLEKYDLQGFSLEGLLYPDTYLFQKNYPSGKIVIAMVDNFFNQLEEIKPDYRNMDVKVLIDTIILASIVEREYRDPSEAPLMAGVFYNRLKHQTPIPLGSCATIVYIITDIQKKDHPEFILYSDLEIESPYNTYLNSGLPPGPISNPGKVALEASFYPEDSEFLYFLLKNAESGQHIFTKNLTDHTAAYNLYIKSN